MEGEDKALREAGHSVGIPLVADGRLLKSGRHAGAECQCSPKCQCRVVGMSLASQSLQPPEPSRHVHILLHFMNTIGVCICGFEPVTGASGNRVGEYKS